MTVYKALIEACDSFLNAISDGCGTPAVVSAQEMDAMIFRIFRSATDVLEQQQKEYLEFMCQEECRFFYNRWVQERDKVVRLRSETTNEL